EPPTTELQSGDPARLQDGDKAGGESPCPGFENRAVVRRPLPWGIVALLETPPHGANVDPREPEVYRVSRAGECVSKPRRVPAQDVLVGLHASPAHVRIEYPCRHPKQVRSKRALPKIDPAVRFVAESLGMIDV